MYVTIILTLQVWQAFVGARKRHMERYYQNLIASETNAGEGKDYASSLSVNGSKQPNADHAIPEKWRRQIEKVIRCMGLGLYRSIFLIRRCYYLYLVLHSRHLPSLTSRVLYSGFASDIPRPSCSRRGW